MAKGETRHGWIDLLIPDGPFLSAAALDKTTVGESWPTRLDAEPRALLTSRPASAVDDGWDNSTWDGRRARVRRLLTELLGYEVGTTLDEQPSSIAKHHIYDATVKADFAVHVPNDPADTRMVIVCGPDATDTAHQVDPSRTSNHQGWVSTPVQRAALLARHHQAGLALVTNGEAHLLVNVVTGTTGHAIWTLNGLEDRGLQDSFVALLHKERLLHRTHSTAQLIELSQDRQQELTDTLGLQVRRAAEALVNAISRANRTTRGELLKGVAGTEVYTAAVGVLMRIVFVLVAEERGLLPLAENDLYAQRYAVSSLIDQLEEDEYRNRSAMQRRAQAWSRLLALSRAVHGGIDHAELRLPAYGGDLFDPEKHPFLEGRAAGTSDASTVYVQHDVGVVDDHTVLTILRHLQVADGQRISFRTLDVEQIGHIYEALLDHSAITVDDGEVVLGLRGKPGAEPEVLLGTLESWAADGVVSVQLADLGVATNADTVSGWLNSGLDSDSDVARTLHSACGNDDSVVKRVHQFAPILRTDARGMSLVFLPGDVYITETSSKRDSGTAYTPRGLADEVAKHALDPLIYEPGPHNEADEAKWKLRPPGELLDLRVCDPAVGSAAILVAAARYLAEALLQARIEYGELPENALATAAADEDALDIRIEARRDIVSNCIYGVDRDPMAAEMAKLSLWLITMAKDRPFTFLDHAIKCGDSLLGITSLDQLRNLHLDPSRVTGDHALPMQFGGQGWWDRIDGTLAEVEGLRDELRDISVVDIEDAHRKAELHVQAETASQDLKLVADAIVAVCLVGADKNEAITEGMLAELGPIVADLGNEAARTELREQVHMRAQAGNPSPEAPRRFLHWPLEFPEVFDGQDGFDAVVANPPFMGGQGISGNLGGDYRAHLVRYLVHEERGSSDLVGYFARRIAQIARAAGFLATNSITQGQTLKVSLGPLVNDEGWTIYRAVRSTPWPGKAGVNISKIWCTRRVWAGLANVNGEEWHKGIAATLEKAGNVRGAPRSLAANSHIAFQGYKIVAEGFALSPEEAAALIDVEASSSEVIRPYANGDHVNGPIPRHARDRLVIDFGTRSRVEAEMFRGPFSLVESRVRPFVETKSRKQPRSYGSWARRWWQFERSRGELREAIEPMEHVLALARTSKVMYPVFVPSDWCLTDALIVFAYDDYGHFGVLSSTFHWWWAVKPPGTGGSSFKTDPRYTPTISFQTFPQPALSEPIEKVGRRLNEHREEWMVRRDIGLRIAYNQVNDPDNLDDDVQRVRDLHVELDLVVRAAYAASDPDHAWETLELDHAFQDCGSLGTRFTIGEETRSQMIDWLLELNYRRWAEENHTAYEQVLKETGNA